MKQIIKTDKAPAAIGPYSQAVEAKGFLFLSGQLPIDPSTGQFVEGGVAEQTEQVLANIQAVLVAAGCNLSSVVKCTCFMQDLADFKDMNEVYNRWFTENHPARSTFEVAGLPRGALIEIEAIAVR